jgi:RNA polymerase sigma-70 factor (ECF subfamily)
MGRRIGAMAAGRAAEFESLYERHSREVWAVAYARWLDGDLALDVAQEAFLRLWKCWQAGERIENPKAWLMRVARNLAEDTVKSAFHRNGTAPPEQLNGVVGYEASPLDRLERAETFERLRTQIRELSESDRLLLTLRYAFEYDVAQIAEHMGIQASAVHMRLSRARQRLADRIIEHGGIEQS